MRATPRANVYGYSRDVSLRLFLTIGAGFLGACIGSFLTVVTSRVPQGSSIVQPGSACPRCGTDLAWFDNIPIVSWFVLRGKCRSCKLPIPPRYVVLELITCAAFVGCALVLPAPAVLPAAAALAGIIAAAEMYRTQHRLYWKVLLTAMICTVVLGGAGAMVW